MGRGDDIISHPLKRQKLRHRDDLVLISRGYPMLGQSEDPGLILASSQNHGPRSCFILIQTEDTFRLPIANGLKSKVFSKLVEIALINTEKFLKQKFMMQEQNISLKLSARLKNLHT